MKKLLSKVKFKEISDAALWSVACGLSCVSAVFISSIFVLDFSPYIASAAISLGIRMIALTVFLAVIIDLLCANIPDE